MFKTILIPVDGSPIALASAKVAIELAMLCQASIYVIFVASPYHRFIRSSGIGLMPKRYQQQFEQHEKEQGEAALSSVQALAEKAKIPCTAEIIIDKIPARAITEAAHKKGADLVVMGSHGFRGVKKLLLGSTTQEVLVRIGAVPVLVHRDQAAADAFDWEDDEEVV
jgi:nucleotide-binding universal stress UspA family protein